MSALQFFLKLELIEGDLATKIELIFYLPVNAFTALDFVLPLLMHIGVCIHLQWLIHFLILAATIQMLR